MINKFRTAALAWVLVTFASAAMAQAIPASSGVGSSQPSAANILNMLQQSGGGGAMSGPAQVVTPAAPAASAPLPVVPTASGAPVMFGSQLFSGRFSTLSYSGFNPEYQIMTGDQLLVRMWGSVTYEATQTVDAQGNIFLPNIGPVKVIGVRNTELNRQVEDQVKRTFRANVGVYATLVAAQPVKIYVTGFVRAPGLYGGLSSDSVLNFLDKAGGIDPDRGSYLTVQVSRAGALRATLNLYEFLLKGKMEGLQLQDGDMITVQARKFAVTVAGEAQNPYVYELPTPTISAAGLIALAQPTAAATHMSIVRNTGVQLKSEYFPLAQTANVVVSAGDLVTFTADKYPTTILVRIQGAQMGDRSVVLPNGSTLKDLEAKLNPSPTANMPGMQLFRKSVQARQKVTLEISLRKLEAAALTARSATSEEAALRQVESNMMLSFIERARQVVPLGQVVLSGYEQAQRMALEDGDVINIPERSSLVLVSGEVLFPNAMLYSPKSEIEDYIVKAGGFTQKADTSRQLVMRVDGSVAPNGELPGPGDEIMVLPKIDSKNIEVARGLTQILYQIAIAAKVTLGL